MINNWNRGHNEQYNYSTHKYFANYVSTIPCTMFEYHKTQSAQYTHTSKQRTLTDKITAKARRMYTALQRKKGKARVLKDTLDALVQTTIKKLLCLPDALS